MKKYICVLELEADEKSIEADIRYNYSIDGKDYSVLGCVWFNEENKEEKIKTYEDGLNEAWKLAGRIDKEFTQEELIKIFGNCVPYEIIDAINPKEAIQKINEYDNRNIEIGDEVEFNKFENSEGKYAVLIDVKTENRPCRDVLALTDKGEVCIWNRTDFVKTGRHFSEIEDVLNKLKEKRE